MKKYLKKVAALAIAVTMVASTPVYASNASDEPLDGAPVRIMEHLDRGFVAMKTTTGVFMSWRFLGNDPDDVSFYIYRNGVKIATVSGSTNYIDVNGTAASVYTISSVIKGIESPQESTLIPMMAQNGSNNGNYFDVVLQNPGPQPAYMFRNPRGDLFNATGKYYYMPVDVSGAKQAVLDLEAGAITKSEYEAYEQEFKDYVFALGLDETGGTGPTLRDLGYDESGRVPYRTDASGNLVYNMRTYTANDMAVGDLDGDGQYELIVKWDPSDSRDSMISYGTSAPCIIDAYELDGTPLWRINMGYNIRAGAHDTQMLVYDFNNDGKAELILRTADGTTSGTLDANGNYTVTDYVGPQEAASIKDYILNSDLENLQKYSTKINNSQTVAWEDPVYNNNSGEYGEDGYITTSAYSGNEANQTWSKVFIYGPSNNTGDEYITAFGGDGRIIDSVEYEFAIKEDMFSITPYCRRSAGASDKITRQGEEFWLTHEFGNNYEMFGDTTANRSGRFVGAVALLDGETPSALIERGYYAKTTIAAYNLVDDRLVLDSTFDSSTYENHTDYECRGNHNTSVGDVDGDGCDEIIYGSISFKKYDLSGDRIEPMYVVGGNVPDTATPPATEVNIANWIKEHTNEDGSPKEGARATFNYHGDAIHLLPIDKSNKLALFTPHEDPGDAVRGWSAGMSAHNAATGELIVWAYRPGDTGRGAAGNIDPRTPNSAKAWANNGYYDLSTGNRIGTASSNAASNSLIYWSGSLVRQTFDGQTNPVISAMDSQGKWNTIYTASNTSNNNGSKANAGITVDLFGDWREEIINRVTGSNNTIRISTTNMPTVYKIRTLMHDPMYRLGIVWQNVCYNQPPHPSFFLGYDDAAQSQPILPAKRTDIKIFGAEVIPTSIKINAPGLYTVSMSQPLKLTATVSPDNASNQNVEWKSASPEIVTIDKQGNLTYVKAGMATITAKTSNGLESVIILVIRP